jgi:hypothetical protein
MAASTTATAAMAARMNPTVARPEPSDSEYVMTAQLSPRSG